MTYRLILASATLACVGTAHATLWNVEIASFTFSPQHLTIDLGDEVRWINIESVPHTATSGTNYTPDGEFDSGFLSTSQSFTHQFTSLGTYWYYCAVHTSGMTFGNDYSVTVVPEPSALAVLAGLPLLALFRRRKA